MTSPDIDFVKDSPKSLSPTFACGLLRHSSRRTAFCERIARTPETDAMRLGILAHEKVLTPGAKSDKHLLEPETCQNAKGEEVAFSRKMKAGREWVDAQREQGKIVFSQSEERVATEMCDALQKNRAAVAFLTICDQREKFYQWRQPLTLNGEEVMINCRTRLDGHGKTPAGKHYILSYKTTPMLDPLESWMKGVRTFFYDVQSVAEAFALDAVGIARFEESERWKITPTAFIVQSTRFPYESVAFTHNEQDIMHPRSVPLWYEACYRFQTAWNEIHKYGMPAHASYQEGSEGLVDIATGGESSMGAYIAQRVDRITDYRNSDLDLIGENPSISAEDLRGFKPAPRGEL